MSPLEALGALGTALTYWKPFPVKSHPAMTGKQWGLETVNQTMEKSVAQAPKFRRWCASTVTVSRAGASTLLANVFSTLALCLHLVKISCLFIKMRSPYKCRNSCFFLSSFLPSSFLLSLSLFFPSLFPLFSFFPFFFSSFFFFFFWFLFLFLPPIS